MATSIGEPEGLQGLRDEMREALVFDYDGVLADTEFLHWKSWELCFLNMSFLARTSNASAWFASGHLRRFRSHKKRSLLTTLGAYRPGLVTSSERSKVEPILRASAIYEKFDAMVFGEDVTVHKPAPDPYLLVAQKLGVSTGIAFEDSRPGLESALAAGFKVVRLEEPKDLTKIVAQSLRRQTNPTRSLGT